MSTDPRRSIRPLLPCSPRRYSSPNEPSNSVLRPPCCRRLPLYSSPCQQLRPPLRSLLPAPLLPPLLRNRPHTLPRRPRQTDHCRHSRLHPTALLPTPGSPR